MHGAVRQEIIFADHLGQAGRPPGWLSIPLVLTSHTWENSKNEQSHQDPAMAELMLGEASHISRVVFPPDFNTAAAVVEAVYGTRGQIWTLVVSKGSAIPDLFSADEARALVRDGAARLPWAGWRPEQAQLIVTAVGAYQLGQALRASERLAARQIEHAVVAMLEPGRFRAPRDTGERARPAPPAVVARCYPSSVPARLFLTHTRPEGLLGALGPLHTGAATTGLGFSNVGGTLSIEALLFVNGASWAHALQAAARLLDLPRERLLDDAECAALDGRATPEGVIVPAPA
jgi:phosphoketolase